MPEVKRIWRINGLIEPLAPAPLVEQSIEYDLPDGWHGLANGITLPRGRKYGVAHFLVAQKDLASLQGYNTLDCYHNEGQTTWKGYYVESYEAVTKQKTPAYWVRLVDPRWLLERSSARGKRYNLRKSSTEFVTATTMGGTPYTWSQVISDLWSLLPPQAGSAPSLPRTPVTTPENLYFDGVGAWGAVNQCLTAIGMCVVYDPFQGQFTFVDLTTTQSISYPTPTHLLFNGKPGGGDYDLPEIAGVLYHWLPNDASYAPFRKAPYYAEGTIGGEQGTYEVTDTTFNYEGRDLSDRTDEIANALRGLLDPMVNPVDRIYSGVWNQLPGSRLSEMRWTSDGYRGFETHAIYDFVPFEWPQLPPYDAGTRSSSGGGGDQILFRVIDVVCGAETYVIAEWTHFTGGCDSDPPGVDPYTGYVQIFDSCVFGYYTVDFLLSGSDGYGATGRATYWYTRDDCVGRWIVDSVCGQPECA